MTLHVFTWTPRSALLLAASVVTGSWAFLAALVAGIAHLFGAEAVAASAGSMATVLLAAVAGLLVLAALLGCVLERPVLVKRSPARSTVSYSRPVV
jgi:hypothetical protein